MDQDNLVFEKIKLAILAVVFFLFPLFFLPTTQEFFSTNKLYLLAVAAVALILTSTAELLTTKKIVWKPSPLDKGIILFAVAICLSTLISSPNKIQALLNPTFGVVSMLSLCVVGLYFLRVTDAARNIIVKAFMVSSILVGLFSLIFYFQPFKNANLPLILSFLKVPYLNTLGNALDVAILLGFALVVSFMKVSGPKNARKDAGLYYVTLAVAVVGIVLSVYVLVKPLVSNQAILPYPPFRLSWAAAIDTFKNPINALFGVGVDNFSAIFTHEKDLVYNQSNQWQISSFNVSRSALLHVLTEGGLLSLISMIIVILTAFQEAATITSKKVRMQVLAPLYFALAAFILLPPSLVLFFVLFFAVTLVGGIYTYRTNQEEISETNLAKIPAVYIVLAVISLLLSLGSLFFLGRAYLADYYMRQAVIADAQGNLQKVYDNHVQAILLNPYIEQYRVSFSQVNMYIANSIAASKAKTQGNAQDKNNQLSDADKQNIAQRIQIAISESKAAVALNPQKAINWENLANIYKNILTVAQGADAWTVSAYQRAIAIDPNNPMYRLNLGGVYYSLADYADAQRFFENAANLKPDWANAYYNLAWAAYQKNDYQTAVSAMENVLSLLSPKKDSTDYKKAMDDLDQFKKKLPQQQTTEQNATPSAKVQGQEKLSLPTPATATVEPKIQLPKEASPEAK